jgi:hypothetical protein
MGGGLPPPIPPMGGGLPPPMPMGGGPPPPMGGGFGMGGPPPPFGGGGPSLGVGGAPPPPVAPRSISGSIGGPIGGPPPPMPGPAPVARTSSPLAGPSAAIDMDEVQRMQRRIDQLTSELRMVRGGGDRAVRMEELEEKVSRLERDNQKLEEAYKALEKLAANAGDADVSRAVFQLSRAEEVVSGLSDVLSELRINMLAAEGEIEQYASILPHASYELVREAVRSSRQLMETARDYMRRLREAR